MTNLSAVVIPILSAIGGYFLKYYLDKKQTASSGRAQYKREMYQNFVDRMLSFYQNPAPTDAIARAERTRQYVESIKEFQKKYVLDASPAVIRAIKRQQHYYKVCTDLELVVDGRTGGRLVSKVFKAMRRDIGTSNWGLGDSGSVIFAPVLINTYEQDMHPLWWGIKNRLRQATILPTRLHKWLHHVRSKLYQWLAQSP